MNTNPIPEKLKERFEQILEENVVRIFGAQQKRIIDAMYAAYQLAESESKQLRYDYEAAVLRIDELEKRVADSEKWISIEERLPDNGRDVLVGDSESDIVCTAWYSSFEECFNRQVGGMNITHWRELPTPPVK